MTPFHRSHTCSHSNCSPILYRLRDKARYWSKIAIFFIPRLHSMSIYRRVRLELCMVWYRKKLEWCSYPMVKRIWWCVYPFRHRSNRQTDRHLATAVSELCISTRRALMKWTAGLTSHSPSLVLRTAGRLVARGNSRCQGQLVDDGWRRRPE